MWKLLEVARARTQTWRPLTRIGAPLRSRQVAGQTNWPMRLSVVSPRLECLRAQCIALRAVRVVLSKGCATIMMARNYERPRLGCAGQVPSSSAPVARLQEAFGSAGAGSTLPAPMQPSSLARPISSFWQIILAMIDDVCCEP